MRDAESYHIWSQPLTLVLAIGTLMLLGQALWFYLTGDYQRITAPALLAPIMLMATLLAPLGRDHTRAAACLVLACGVLLSAVELTRPTSLPALWIGLPPILALLLLPPIPAMLLNLGLTPVWMTLPGTPQPDSEMLLSYLSLISVAVLAPWGILRHQALLQATDPWDPECRALSCPQLHEQLSAEIDRTELLDQPLAILLIHLPQLEVAEEQFGPQARLALLDGLCQTLDGRCRAHDILGRATADIFWLVMPDTTASGALLVQQRLDRALEAVILVETGPLETRSQLIMQHAGEDATSLVSRLHSASQSLARAQNS